MLLCPSCNQIWHINNPTRSNHQVHFITCRDENSTDLSTSQYSPNHNNGQDSGFADYDMSDSEMDCQSDIDDMCRIATLAEHFGLTSFRTYQKEVIHEALIAGYNCSPANWQWKEPLLPISCSLYWKDEHCYLTYDITDGRSSSQIEKTRRFQYIPWISSS